MNTSSSRIKFTPIPIFSSNYIWLIEHLDFDGVYIVDPGESQSALNSLSKRNIRLKALLITHSHNDHTGGIDDITREHKVPVIGPDCLAIPQINQSVSDGDIFELWPGISCSVLHLPGHLPEHIAFMITESNTQNNSSEALPASLMCGDVMFSSGCGRMFTGPADVYQPSLARIANLAPNTRLYCAHEYTLDNIAFAQHIEPDNPYLEQKRQNTLVRIAEHKCSLPTDVETERKTNPFIRTHIASLRTRVSQLSGKNVHNDIETFAALRSLKDTF